MQAPPSQDEIDLYSAYWNALSGNNMNIQTLSENVIVNFYRASNLNNSCLEKVWIKSNPNNVKLISKAEFFLGVRLIALAQKGYNLDFIPNGITIPQPTFMGYENILNQFQQNKMKQNQFQQQNIQFQSTQSPQPQKLLSSQYNQYSIKKNTNYSFKNNTAPIEWFIRQGKRMEYTNIFEKYQNNGVLRYTSLSEVVKDEPVDNDDLEKIWRLLDKFNIKVIRKAQFIIFMHILESCKNGDAIPMSIPFSIIQSVGAENEMNDKSVPPEPSLMSFNNNNGINKSNINNNSNNINSNIFNNMNNNKTETINNNNNDMNNNNDLFDAFSNTTNIFNNNNTIGLDNNKNITNSNSNIFNNTNITTNNMFSKSVNQNNDQIDVASLKDYTNLLEYKKKLSQSLKEEIQNIQSNVKKINEYNQNYQHIIPNIERSIQQLNEEGEQLLKYQEEIRS